MRRKPSTIYYVSNSILHIWHYWSNIVKLAYDGDKMKLLAITTSSFKVAIDQTLLSKELHHHGVALTN